MTATCACGQATITVNALPTMHGVCHCTNCKRRTGSAFGISAYFDKTAIVETKGETKTYAFHHSAQNHDQERHFCANCGTTLFWFLSVARVDWHSRRLLRRRRDARADLFSHRQKALVLGFSA